jgi:hypothetical protein
LQGHPKDAEFLNKPIEFYNLMQTAFGSTMAIGKFAMGSGEALGVFSGYGDSEGGDATENQSKGGDAAENQSKGGDVAEKVEGSDVSKSNEAAIIGSKRKRSCLDEQEMIVLTNMTEVVNNVVAALRETGLAHVDGNLYKAVMGAPGFTEEALMVALSHLLDNKAQGRGYVNMSEGHRVLWLRTWLGKHYYL